ncbi:zinc finger BED domain-containing protein 5-like [Palaemon carinicauda]|uniref:zinc finger BED domain-containing protein 5-like n=1 Tax=Palaemon carinicauda TaxID=392227 RepID=UPI0035B57FE8
MDLWLKTGSLTKKKTEFQNNNQDSTGLKEERNDANSATQIKLLEAGADVMDEGNTADTNQSSTDASVTTVGHKQTHQETAKKKCKYCNDYLKLGIFWQGNSEDPIPQCVLCYETLANEAMKPSNLRRHFESRHKEYVGKPIEFFQRKCNELDIHRKKEASSFFISGENAKDTESSYKVSLLISKTGKAHSIGKTLVKPAAKIMTEIMLGEKASKEIKKIPLSNDTVKKRITSMAENVKVQLVSQLQQSLYFSLQLDESTDIGNEANLLCFVRYIYCGEVHDEFLFCRPLPTNTTGEAIFNVGNDFIVQNEHSWSRCVGISTDGATAMTDKLRGLVSRVKSIVPQVKAAHCCIHREQLAVKHMLTCLKTVLEEAEKIVNFIKGKALNTRLFIVLCEEMGSEYTKLLYHTEVRWLTRGKVLSRLFELREEVQIFLYERHDLYNRMHDT